MTLNLLFIAGSARKESLNKKLAQYACALAKKECSNATFVDLADYPMPIYNGDLEDGNGLPEKAIELKKIFSTQDGIFIASPEYNSGYSALLKNTIDWISRKHEEDEKPLVAFQGKVAAIAAASPGALGGLRGLAPLRMLLGNIGMTVIPTQAAISQAMEAFDNNGNMTNSAQADMMDKLIQQFINTSKSLKS